MRGCLIPFSCHDGQSSSRNLTHGPSFCQKEVLSGGNSIRGGRRMRLGLHHPLQRDAYRVPQARLAALRSSIVCFFSNRSILSSALSKGDSALVKGDLLELTSKILPEQSERIGKVKGRCKILQEATDHGCGGNNGNCGGSGSAGSGWHWESHWESDGDKFGKWFCPGQACLLFLLLVPCIKQVCIKLFLPFLLSQIFLQRGLLANADVTISPLKPSSILDGNGKEAFIAKSEMSSPSNSQPDTVFEVRGGKWTRVFLDADRDEFVVDPVRESDKDAFDKAEHSCKHQEKSLQVRSVGLAIKWCSNFLKNVLLPEGFPQSVTGDYLEYTIWRMGQSIASQVNGVLTTQALLFAVGLGKGAIPTAAALNWVLKDGIGYLSKILLANYGRHFDVYPKGWRLLADLLENGSYALELLTPIYPHLFIYLGAMAGAGRSAAGLIQGATRSCFYAGFAAQRNFAEVIAKGEAQGMISKFVGIALGIALSASVGASGPKLAATFITVIGIHMFCNLKSYQAVQLRTLNPYRACLVFGEYIRAGTIASVEEVNAAEPIFSGVPFSLFTCKRNKKENGNLLSLETKETAERIVNKLKLGVSFSNVIRSQSEADRLFKIYKNEKYVLVERLNAYQALLKEGATSHDLLKLMLQVCYLHQLRLGLEEKDYDFYVSNPMEISYRLANDSFDEVQRQVSHAGWSISDGLVARPLPYRLLNMPV